MSLRDYTLHLVANVEQQLNVDGNFLGVMEATAPVFFSVDQGPYIKRKAGQSQTGEYSQVRIKSSVDQDVIIIAGLGTFNNSNQDVTVNVNATVAPGNQNTALADVAVVPAGVGILAGANAARKFLIIKSLNSNGAGDFSRIGEAPGIGMGVEIGAGEALQLETTAAISAYNTGASDMVFSLLEVNRV